MKPILKELIIAGTPTFIGVAPKSDLQ